MSTLLPSSEPASTLPPATRSRAGRKFIWLLVPPWDNVWTRQNHFVTRLTRLGAEVLYVENPFALTTMLRQGRWPRARARFEEKATGLTVLTPPPLLPGGLHSEMIARVNASRLVGLIKDWLKQRGWRDYVCWCRVPLAQPIVKCLKPAQVYYDVTDDYRHFYQSTRIIANLDRREKELVARCHRIFYTAPALSALDNLRGRPSCLLPNGVDYELFAGAASPELPVHPMLGSVRSPVIGCVGLTSDWTDFELLRKLGARFPGQVVMVGPIHPRVETMARSIHGVQWTGFIERREELPSLIKGFAVCFLPFLTNELTRQMNPLKVWEYLATGKPFVSVDLPGLGEARSLVDVARDHHEFLELVSRRLDGEPSGRALERQRLAQRHSWDALFDQLVDHLEAA